VALISEPRCPQCGNSVPTRALWSASETDRFGMLRTRTGVVCSQCGIHLKVRQSRIAILNITLLLGAGALAGYVVAHGSNKDASVLLAVLIVGTAVAFQFRYSPCFAQLEIASGVDAEKLSYPLSTKATPIVELDDERGERELKEAVASGAESEATKASSPWRCESCGEDNPGNFNECWKCQAMRPITEGEGRDDDRAAD
jgi:predicted RNA-binding Zn-ribbon protein involved in translation (DUF1610 family)